MRLAVAVAGAVATGSAPRLVSAEAHEADPPVAEIITIEEEWVGLDLLDAEDTTRAVTIREVELDPGTAVLGDLMEGQPGVVVQRTGPGQGAPVVRGMIGSAVLVLVDGMRFNDAIFRPAPNQYLALVDPWAIERVELVRGPGSVLHGSDAIGGTINLVTPLPLFEGDAWRHRGHAVLAVAAADRSTLARAAAMAGRGDRGLSLGVTWQRHDDVRTGGGTMLTPADYQSLAADVTAHLDRGRSASTLWLQTLTQPELPRTDELRPGFGQTTAAAEEWAYRPSRRSAVHLRHVVRRPSPRVLGLELHLAWQRLRDDRRIRDAGSEATLVEQNHDDSLGVAARATAAAFGGKLVVGADYWADRVRSDREERSSAGVMEVAARFADGAHLHQPAGYVQWRHVAGPLTVQAGARAALAVLRVPEADRGQGGAVTRTDWAGELGARRQLSRDLSLVVNLGRSFRVPNVHDLSSLGPRPGDRWQVPADQLGPEHAVGVDVGIRVAGDRVEGELFGFAVRWDDRIEAVPTGEMLADGRAIVQSANVGSTRLLGAEVALELVVTGALRVAIDAGFAVGEQTTPVGDREPADRIPPLGGGVAVRWRAGGMAVEGGVRGAAAQRRLSERDRTDPRIDPAGTPGWVTLHAEVSRAWARTDLVLSLDNVLDRRYRMHASGADAAGIDVGLLIRRRW